jgi:hypothetical protein
MGIVASIFQNKEGLQIWDQGRIEREKASVGGKKKEYEVVRYEGDMNTKISMKTRRVRVAE